LINRFEKLNPLLMPVPPRAVGKDLPPYRLKRALGKQSLSTGLIRRISTGYKVLQPIFGPVFWLQDETDAASVPAGLLPEWRANV